MDSQLTHRTQSSSSSPLKNTQAGVDNYSTSTNPHRGTLRYEIQDKLKYDQDSVLRRIRFHDVRDDDARTIEKKVRKVCREKIETLKGLAAGQSSREKEMYKPLSDIMIAIIDATKATPSSAANNRYKFVRENSILSKDDTKDPYTVGFPQRIPDFVLIDSSETGKVKWSNTYAFIEVKAKESDFTPSNIIVQATDYARLLLSAKPFLVFAIGILIYGTKFRVAAFDRDGLSFSPQKDVYSDLKDFVKVIRCITYVCSPHDLGLDPSVQYLAQEGRFLIGPIGDDGRQWKTEGNEAIWSSLSFLGRGTEVWRVREVGKHQLGKVVIMKSAWRLPKRDPESDIYAYIQAIIRRERNGSPHPGIAAFITGGDVTTTHNSNRRITVGYLRDRRLPEVEDDSPILHRSITGAMGYPIWKWKNPTQLVKGLLAALNGHEFLCNNGILHRDISAGNILLTEDPNPPPGGEGFLTDFDYAWVQDQAHTERKKVIVTGLDQYEKHRRPTEEVERIHTKFKAPQRGAAISGTFQFMAGEVLQSLHDETQITQRGDHDVDSIVWVHAYSVLRGLLRRMAKNSKGVPKEAVRGRIHLEDAFTTAFGQHTLNKILEQRTTSVTGFSWVVDIGLPVYGDSITKVLPKPMDNLIRQLGEVMSDRRTRIFQWKPIPPLTHEALRKMFEEAIEGLAQEGPYGSSMEYDA